MLRPHDGEYTEFRQIGLAPEQLDQASIFIRLDAMFRDDFGRWRALR